jgi:hypothetical protein
MPKKKNLKTGIERLLEDFSVKELQAELNKRQSFERSSRNRGV